MSIRNLLLPGLLSGFVALSSVLPGVACATVAGVFQFVAGEVSVVSQGGAAKPARKGTPLSVGETVMSAKSGLAQIKMADGATVVVQPETRVSVAEFRYEGVEDGNEKVRYRLERGGIRSITGAIGRSHKDNYVIETPIAHMGVRGTDHESYFIPGDAAGGDSRPPGAYSKVNVGQTYIRTPQGEVVVGPNQVGFVAAPSDRPALLPGIPSFFNRSLGPQVSPRPGQAGGVVAQETPAVPDVASPQAARSGVVQPVAIANGLSVSNIASTDAGSAGVGGSGAAGGSSGGVGSSTSATAVGYVLAAGSNNVRTGINLALVQNGAAVANAGGDAAWGVNWGSWQGGVATVGAVATQGSTHFIGSSQITTSAQLAAMPASVISATYSLVGGPAPSNQAGTQGTLSSLNIGVNFSTMQITSYAASATVGAAAWSVNGSGTVAQFTGSSGIALGGSCTGCTGGAGAVTANGTAHGAFVGSAAERMITSFGARAAAQAVSGVGLLAR